MFLHNEILDFCRFVAPSKEFKEKRHKVIELMRTIVKEIFPTAEVLVFGSTATGLSLPKSDIDFLVYDSN